MVFYDFVFIRFGVSRENVQMDREPTECQRNDDKPHMPCIPCLSILTFWVVRNPKKKEKNEKNIYK